jgi:hypothetical protein
VYAVSRSLSAGDLHQIVVAGGFNNAPPVRGIGDATYQISSPSVYGTLEIAFVKGALPVLVNGDGGTSLSNLTSAASSIVRALTP